MNEKFSSIVNSITTIVCILGFTAIIMFGIDSMYTANKRWGTESQIEVKKLELKQINEQRKTDSLYMNQGYIKVPNIDPSNYHWEKPQNK